MSDSGIFKAAVKLSPHQRPAFLDQACGQNRELRGEVESLLRAHDASGSFLRDPPARTEEYEPIAERPGTVIGPYKLMEQIGEGGFGLVFVAEQQQPVRRKVALKIIKPGMDSAQVIARFEAERQALAIMDHQNIAKVFDAGTTDSGRPYFVMELVHGVPITDYCDANKLTPRQRLELFVPVCHAIQHAHQKGIIHRDIKPSNILVTMYDDKPVPKVIDFGVAKAIEQRLTERTVYTQFGTLVGTFEYMSPEQAEMNAFGVDTRSDIYALGVVLYELLTGTTPLERPRLREAAFDEIRRLIREEEPQRPSIRLSTLGRTGLPSRTSPAGPARPTSDLTKVAAARQTDPAKLSRLMRGELDWVVMRCLEKDRTRRYETANGLARDIQRYLQDEMVEARPPTVGYRLRKYARKNMVALVTVATFAIALTAGTLISIWQASRALVAENVARQAEQDALAAQQRAEREKANATAALDFISQGILSPASPDTGADPDIKLRTVVDQIAENLDKGMRQPPLVEASIRHALGNIYVFERFPEALRQFQLAYAIRLEVLGNKHPDTIRTMICLGHPDLWREERRTKKETEQSRGERYADDAWKMARDHLPPSDLSTLIAMRNVAWHRELADRYPEADDLYHQFLDACNKTRGPLDTWSITAHIDLAWHYLAQKKFDQAEEYAKRAVELRRQLHKTDDHYLTYLAIETLASVYQRQERYADAERLQRQLIDGFHRHVGPHSPSYLSARSSLAFVLNRQNKHKEAVHEYEEALPLFRQEPGYRNHARGLGFSLTGYGDSLNKLQRYDYAEPVLREALQIREADLRFPALAFTTQSILGESLIGLKRYEDAEDSLQKAYQGQLEWYNRDPELRSPEFMKRTLERLVKLYEAWNKPDEAAKWRQELEARQEAVTKP